MSVFARHADCHFGGIPRVDSARISKQRLCADRFNHAYRSRRKKCHLIISFAKTEYEKGKSISEAALAGARIRIRPILMTSFAFFWLLPLWLASGSGSVSRMTLGTVVLGVCWGRPAWTSLLCRSLFQLFERLAVRFSKKSREEHAPKPPEPNG